MRNHLKKQEPLEKEIGNELSNVLVEIIVKDAIDHQKRIDDSIGYDRENNAFVNNESSEDLVIDLLRTARIIEEKLMTVLEDLHKVLLKRIEQENKPNDAVPS
jgi:hypothetical protein